MKKRRMIIIAMSWLIAFPSMNIFGTGKRETETFVYICQQKTKLGILTVEMPSGLAKVEERTIGKHINPNSWGKGLSISPNGQWVAFSASQLYENGDIYISRISGEAVIVQQTSTPGCDRYPEWSPDGTKIIFTTDIEPTEGSLFQQVCEVSVRFEAALPINEPRIIVDDPGWYSDPVYSPNGSKIAYFRSCVTPYGAIVILNAIDSNQISTIWLNGFSLIRARSLRWRPDSRFLFSASIYDNNGNSYLDHCYIIDNSEIIDITQDETTHCAQPSWYKDEQGFQHLPRQYRPKQVVFMNNNGLYSIRDGYKYLIYQFKYDDANPIYKPRYSYPAN